MREDELKRLEELRAAGTPGKWFTRRFDVLAPDHEAPDSPWHVALAYNFASHADGEPVRGEGTALLIAAAVNALPARTGGRVRRLSRHGQGHGIMSESEQVSLPPDGLCTTGPLGAAIMSGQSIPAPTSEQDHAAARAAKPLLLAALALLALAAPFLVAWGCGEPAKPDPLTDELSRINVRHSAAWEAMRQDAHDEDHLKQLRIEWRKNYDAEVAAAYQRHGRKAPAAD